MLQVYAPFACHMQKYRAELLPCNYQSAGKKKSIADCNYFDISTGS